MRAEYMPPERQSDPNVQDPHLLAQCRANPDVFWVQHHNGIFRSTDGAASISDAVAKTRDRMRCATKRAGIRR